MFLRGRSRRGPDGDGSLKKGTMSYFICLSLLKSIVSSMKVRRRRVKSHMSRVYSPTLGGCTGPVHLGGRRPQTVPGRPSSGQTDVPGRGRVRGGYSESEETKECQSVPLQTRPNLRQVPGLTVRHHASGTPSTHPHKQRNQSRCIRRDRRVSLPQREQGWSSQSTSGKDPYTH